MKKIKGSAKMSSSKAGSSSGMQSKTSMVANATNPATQNMQPRPKTQINGQRGSSTRAGDSRLISNNFKESQLH